MAPHRNSFNPNKPPKSRSSANEVLVGGGPSSPGDETAKLPILSDSVLTKEDYDRLPDTTELRIIPDIMLTAEDRERLGATLEEVGAPASSGEDKDLSVASGGNAIPPPKNPEATAAEEPDESEENTGTAGIEVEEGGPIEEVVLEGEGEVPVLEEHIPKTTEPFTPAESREKLRDIVEQIDWITEQEKTPAVKSIDDEIITAQEIVAAGAENPLEEDFVKSEVVAAVDAHREQLTARVAQLKEEAKKYDGLHEKGPGSIEKMFRTVGERYNKVGWKTKVAVGLGLGVGATVASFPLALGCLSGIAAQRVAGLSGSFLRFEKTTVEGKWKKEWAMGKAMLYTAAMTGAFLEFKHLADSHNWAGHVKGWLGHMLGHHTGTGHPHGAQGGRFGHITRGPEVHEPAAAAAAPEVAPTPPEMPSVDATAKHGYEYMAKQLATKLHEMKLNPNDYPEGSDIRQLLEANDSTINTVVHQIASNPNHDFFHTDGTSAQINLDDRMTVGPDGQLHMSGSIEGVQGPEHAHELEIPEGKSQVDFHFETTDTSPDHDTHQYTYEEYKNLPEAGGVSVPETAPEAPVLAPELPDTHTTTLDSSGAAHEVVANHHGVKIPTGEAHIYGAAKRAFIYGGSAREQIAMLSKYLLANPDKVVYAVTNDTETHHAYQIPYRLLEGKLVADAPIRTNGFLGLFSGWRGVTGPEDFRKIIK